MTTDVIEDYRQLHTMVDLLAPEEVHMPCVDSSK
jgi:hypothetical protein